MVHERPSVRGVRVRVRTGYTRVEGSRRASRNGLVSSSPTRNPYHYDSQLFRIACMTRRLTLPIASPRRLSRGRQRASTHRAARDAPRRHVQLRGLRGGRLAPACHRRLSAGRLLGVLGERGASPPDVQMLIYWHYSYILSFSLQSAAVSFHSPTNINQGDSFNAGTSVMKHRPQHCSRGRA